MKTAINNVRIIVGNGDMLNQGSILFDETGILNISQKNQSGDKVVDGTGKTVMPGIIDCHVHLGMPPVLGTLDIISRDAEAVTAFRAYSQALKMLKCGVTTIRNVGTKYDADITLRNMINSGEVIGPRILASGQVICITAGHCNPLGVEVDDVSQAITAARRQIRKGADVLKMMATGGVITDGDPYKAQLSLEQIIAVQEEANRFGKITCAHCIAEEGIRYALEAGLDSIEHGNWVNEELCDIMLEKGIWLVPTLIAAYSEWHPDINKDYSPESESLRKKAKPTSDVARKHFEIAVKKGVKLAFGTDAGTPFNEPTRCALELSLYIEHGVKPMDALVCATRNSAQLLRIDDIVGTIEVGKLADIIMMDGNPVEDIWCIQKIERTYRSGCLLYKR